jgi:hypothetical protein
MSERWTDKKVGYVGDSPAGGDSLSFQRYLREQDGLLLPKLVQDNPDGGQTILRSHGMYDKIITTVRPGEVPVILDSRIPRGF